MIWEVPHTTVQISERSVLGPLLFLIYTKDITDIKHENSQIGVYAHDKLISTSHQRNLFRAHERQLHQISKWLSANKLTVNFGRNFYLKFGRKKSMRNTIRINEKLLKTGSMNKDFGSFSDSDLTLKNHVSYVSKKYVNCLAFCAIANIH